jgi:phosphate transport system substrate-binding protein
METLSGKSGKCSNFGNCSIADARTTVEVAGGMDFVCSECGKPLLLTDSAGASGGSSKALAVGVLVAVLVLAGGGITWSLLAGKKSPQPAPAVVSAPPVAVRPTPPVVAAPAKPAAALPAEPATGHCSEADERAGLCRIAR